VLFLRRLGLAGQHELILEYDPPGQRTGFLIAGASALVLMAIGAWDLHRRHRARTDGSATGAPP
jgi:hypothetical protein